jgi:hypothetical protein
LFRLLQRVGKPIEIYIWHRISGRYTETIALELVIEEVSEDRLNEGRGIIIRVGPRVDPEGISENEHSCIAQASESAD